MVSKWNGSCSKCDQSFIKHGHYVRKTPLAGVTLRIQRVICPACKKTHALIPCFVFPYSQVMAHTKELALRGICYETHTLEELAELCRVEPFTLHRWWQRFRIGATNMLAWLSQKLASTSPFVTWLKGDYSTDKLKCQKFFSLFGLYRSSYYPNFFHDDFNLLCLVKPLFFRQPSR